MTVIVGQDAEGGNPPIFFIVKIPFHPSFPVEFYQLRRIVRKIVTGPVGNHETVTPQAGGLCHEEKGETFKVVLADQSFLFSCFPVNPLEHVLVAE